MKGKVTKRGKSWSIMVDLPRDPVTGKRRQKRITARTKPEAEAKAARVIAEVATGGFVEADAGRLTLAQYLDRWLTSKRQQVKPVTVRMYEDAIRVHILPTIGRAQLAKLTPLDIQGLYSDMQAAGLSPARIAFLHSVLHSALKQAVKWNLLTRNVTEAATTPRVSMPINNIWDERQVAAFLAVAEGDDLAALWRLALLTGMRRGEILALKWEDVDLPRRVLAVKRTYSHGEGRNYEMGEPKSAHSRRSIALPGSAVESLQRHRKKQVEARLAVGSAYQDQGFVFADALGRPIHPNTLIDRFHRLTKRAGLPILRFHDLRHTAATLMLANGTNSKIVQERLGHSDISMTLNRYSHVTLNMQQEAADSLDRMLGKLGT